MQSIHPPMTVDHFAAWKKSFNKFSESGNHESLVQHWLNEGFSYQHLLDVPKLYPAMLAVWEKQGYPKDHTGWYASFAIQDIADIEHWPHDRITQIIKNGTSLTYNFIRQVFQCHGQCVPMMQQYLYKCTQMELKEWVINQLDLSPAAQVAQWFNELPDAYNVSFGATTEGDSITKWATKVRHFMTEHKEETLLAIQADHFLRLYHIADRRAEVHDILKTVLHQRPDLIFKVNWNNASLSLLLQLADKTALAQWRLLDDNAPKYSITCYSSTDHDKLQKMIVPWKEDIMSLWTHMSDIYLYHTQSVKSLLTLLDKVSMHEGSNRIPINVFIRGLTLDELDAYWYGSLSSSERDKINVLGDRRLKNLKKMLDKQVDPRGYIKSFHHVADFYLSTMYDYNIKKRIPKGVNAKTIEQDMLVEEVQVLF